MILSALVCFVFLALEVGAQKYTAGREAEIQCKAYKKVCPIGKQCVIQHLLWPRKMSFPVCVADHQISPRSKICALPPSPGNCAAGFTRWYFNVHTQSCSWFTYGGCDGNLNNFLTRSACEFACLPRTTTPATPESDAETAEPMTVPEESSPAPDVTFVRESPVGRRPAIMAAPAPLTMRYEPDRNDLTGALEMRPAVDVLRGSRRHRRRHLRRNGRKGRKDRRRRKNRRQRKQRPQTEESVALPDPVDVTVTNPNQSEVQAPFAELRMRKTAYRDFGAAQNDDTARERRRRLREERKGRYYKKLRLFTILSH